ncbi:hypothetical protein KIH77_08785 [Bifidobacterium sp. 82T24]|uniref:hypothetical protein n=1 Tax=Bifidobacterium pluvialisilvae TaxID=2834436 RepID=UPI001C580F27|nr:hypothetical protein [Bifidobacterium pluvialisilvae]MBW3088816.1 hypothetical protein [Bifidobacterium pluvialisilvae]
MTGRTYPYRTDDWQWFSELCQGNCETIFDYNDREYFITMITGAGHDGWFVCNLEPFKRDFTYDPISRDCTTFEELADEKIFDGKTKSIRDCYREFDLWQS